MIAVDALHILWKATLAISVAALVLMALPALLRRFFGAGVAYAAWLLVPAALIAIWLPTVLPAMRFHADTAAAPTITTWVPPATTAVVTQTLATVVAAPATIPQSTWPWRAILLGVWACGALATGLLLWRRQRGFVRALGPLSRQGDGLWRAQTSVGLPALLGVAPARIVLPDDFESRYDARERTLMLAHERAHARRGDHLANFAAACLRTLFWFNPLVLVALARFRHDQELACDQAVLLAHPQSRRAYGEAMLKTLMADRLAPLGCHWGLSHPMKDRLMQLKRNTPRGKVRWLGASMVGAMAIATTCAVWATQSNDPLSPSEDIAASSTAKTSGVVAGSIDGAYITTRLLDAQSNRVLRETTFWMAPGMQMPASMYAAPDNTTVKLAYGVEKTADGALRVRMSLGQGTEPRAATAAADTREYLPAYISKVTHREQVIDDGRARVQVDVWRAANPCGKPIALTVKTAEHPAFECKGDALAEVLMREMAGNGALDALPPSAQAQASASAQWQTAKLTFNVLVGRDGHVKDVKRVGPSASAELVERARDSLMQTRYAPHVANGQPVEAWQQVSVNVQAYKPVAER